MPFVDTNDDVFLGEKSFATWLSTVMRPFRAQESSPDMARLAAKLFAQMRESLTAAKNDTAEGFVQRMRAAFPSFDGDVLLHHPLRFLFPKS